MKISLKSCVAGLAGIVFAGSLHAATITHYDINFDDYPTGSFSSGNGWTFSGLDIEIVDSEGGKYLSAVGTETGAKYVRLSTATNATTGTQQLKLTASTSYEWSFSFQLPTEFAPVLIRLDNGSPSNGNFITGMNVNSSGVLSYMTNPDVGTISSQMTAVSTSDFQVVADTWYDVTFLITTGAANQDGTIPISYDFSIKGDNNTFYETSASYTPSGVPNPDLVARSIWGTASNSQPINLRLDNLYLATIPEPGTVSLVIGSVFVGLLASRKKLLRRK